MIKWTLLLCLVCVVSTHGALVRYEFNVTNGLHHIGGEKLRVAWINNRMTAPAIHVRKGDTLEVTVRNNLEEILSLHWHGLEMRGNLLFDGVVGLTQWGIPPGHCMNYKFNTLHERPGTYWYHTHSGLETTGQNLVHGPLIIHPANTSAASVIGGDAFAWGAGERILTLQDYFPYPASLLFWQNVGGLEGSVAKDVDGMRVATVAWHGGLMNGKERAIVRAQSGEKIRLRLINMGAVFAFTVTIDGVPEFDVVAADGSDHIPLRVQAVSLHTAERFDLEFTVPTVQTDTAFYIRARTLENPKQGYLHEVRGILYVTAGGTPVPDSAVPEPQHSERPDPLKLKTFNCWQISLDPSLCLRTTALETRPDLEDAPESPTAHGFQEKRVDFDFYPSPSYGHFVAIDGGPFTQHRNPVKPMLLANFSADRDLHPHSQVLELRQNTTVIIVFRSRTSFPHNIHLHGIHFRVLEVAVPDVERDCTLVGCRLNTDLTTPEATARLKKKAVMGTSALLDTFVIPAGGAVAVALVTTEPGVFFAHCHIDIHREDGMAFIIKVGDPPTYTQADLPPTYPPGPEHPDQLPFPSFPACECFADEDAVFGPILPRGFRCSSDALCRHDPAYAPFLREKIKPLYPLGITAHQQGDVPSWVFSVIVVGVLLVIVCGLCVARRRAAGKSSTAVVAKPVTAQERADVARANVNTADGVGLSWHLRVDSAQGTVVNSQGSLRGGTVLIVAGGCGCGKTALLKHVCGVDMQGLSISTASRVHVCGRNILKLNRKQLGSTAAYVGTDTTVFDPKESVAGIMRFHGNLLARQRIQNGVSKGMLEELIDTTLDALELAHKKQVAFGQLSRGEQQLVRVGVQLLFARPVLLVDDVDAFQDSATLEQLMRALVDYAERTQAAVIVSMRDVPQHVRDVAPGARLVWLEGNGVVRWAGDLGEHQAGETEEWDAAVWQARVSKEEKDMVEAAEASDAARGDESSTATTRRSNFFTLVAALFKQEWKSYRPEVLNIARVVEVVGLALVCGAIFFQIGETPWARGVNETISLLFFALTLATFPRAFSCCARAAVRTQATVARIRNGKGSSAASVVAENLVYAAGEFAGPFVFVIVAFPMAGIGLKAGTLLYHGLMLSLNLIVYAQIGIVCGMLTQAVPLGIVVATLVLQTTVLLAGFYVRVREGVLMHFTNLSPIRFTFLGMLRAEMDKHGSYMCRLGDTSIGNLWCFLEQHPAVYAYKVKGMDLISPDADLLSPVLVLLAMFLCLLLVQILIMRYKVKQRAPKTTTSTTKSTVDAIELDDIVSATNSGDEEDTHDNDSETEEAHGTQGLLASQ